MRKPERGGGRRGQTDPLRSSKMQTCCGPSCAAGETELGAQRTLEPEGKERGGGRQVQGGGAWRGGRREEDGRELSDEKG